MSDTLSVSTLLPWLAETCDAREWLMELVYEQQWWAVTVVGPDAAEAAGPGFNGAGQTLQEALADTWAQVQRWCREQASRGAGA